MERRSQTRLTRPRNSRYRRNIGLRPAMADDLVWGYPCSLTVKHGNREGLNDVRTVLQIEDRRRRCGAWAAKGGSMCALHSNPGRAIGEYSRLCGGEGCIGGLNLQSEQSAKRLASGCFQPSIPIGNGCRLRIHWAIQASGIKLVKQRAGGRSHAMSEFARKPAESSDALHTVSGPSAGPAIETSSREALLASFAPFAPEHPCSPVSTTPLGECKAITNRWNSECDLTLCAPGVRRLLILM
jgi:hypothetical protein